MNVPEEIYEAAQGLPNAAARGQFYTAVLEYFADGTEPSFKMAAPVKALYLCAKPLLDAYKAQTADES